MNDLQIVQNAKKKKQKQLSAKAENKNTYEENRNFFKAGCFLTYTSDDFPFPDFLRYATGAYNLKKKRFLNHFFHCYPLKFIRCNNFYSHRRIYLPNLLCKFHINVYSFTLIAIYILLHTQLMLINYVLYWSVKNSPLRVGLVIIIHIFISDICSKLNT